MKRLLALLLAAIMLMSCSIVVTAVESSSIELDQLYTVAFTENYENEMFTYSFTPNETDCYVIESFSEIDEFGNSADPYIYVYDDEGHEIAYSDDIDDSLDFGCACELEKDKTYDIIIKTNKPGTLNFCISFAELSEDFSIGELEHYTFMTGTYYVFDVFANEENGTVIDGTWSVSNDKIAEIYDESDPGYKMGWVDVDFLASGKFDLTFTSANGVSDSIEITVVDSIELKEDKKTEFYVLPYQDVRFKFVPETSGYYNIYSESDEDFEAELFIYNEEFEQLEYVTENEDSGQEYNFKVFEELEAGKEYYIEVYGYDGAFGSLTVLTEKAKEPSSIDISKADKLMCPVGETFDVEAVLSPVDSNVIVDWSVSDESVLSLNQKDYDENVAIAEFDALKEGTVTITATTVNGISDTATICVCDKIILEEEVPYEAKLKENGEYEFSFTPEYNGTYKIYSLGDADTYASLYDGDIEIEYNHDDGVGENFLIEVDLEAGKTYSLFVDGYIRGREEIFTTTIYASRVSGNATSIVIDRDSDTLTYGVFSKTYIEAYLEPFSAETEEFTWTSSNEDVAYVYDENLYFISEGTATITVTTENGLTDSIEVVVTKTPELNENVANEAVCLYNDEIIYEFTPKLSGTYTFYSVSDDDPAVSLYNKNTEEIGRSDDEGEDYNFYLEADLIAGETYYVLYHGYSAVIECTINIVYNDAIEGDINNDGEVSAKDVTQLRRCAAEGWEINIITEIGDLNADGTIDAKDVTLLRRIAASGWNISLY